MVWVVHTDMSSTYTQNISPRPLRHQPPMESSAWPYKHSVIPKQEPMDYEERSDSGIDFQTSSPGSDHSDNIRYSSPSIPSPIHHPYYPMAATLAMMQYSGVPIPFHNEHNRLTPPSSESMVSPKNLQNVTQTTSSIEDKSEVSNIPQTTLTPCTSPEENNGQSFSNSVGIDALKQLQNAMERTDFLPPSISPNSSENSRECSNTSDMDTENCQEQLINGVPINVPKVNSHGKIKQFKCKHCKFVAITKTEFWRHSRIHIKEEKQLRCTYCEFVTEYKHHFEYHMNNHTGAKPFKCSQCTYTCVNKSMLNSHFKSHSEVYQYRCNDCKYVTKYVHSLKIHLRKYEHKPAVVLNPDGTPNPLPVIDVYGTRRGPKIKFQKPRTVQENLPQREASGSFPFNPLLFNAQQMQFPFPPFVGGFPGVMPNPFLLANFETLINKRQELPNENTPRDNQDDPRENQDSSHTEENHGDQSQEIQSEVEVLDLSKHNKQPAQKNRRKGRAFKLTPGHGNDSDEEFTTMFNNVEVVENVPAETRAETSTREESSSESEEHLHNNKDENCCKFCIIDFGDPVLYSMHMGYHNLQNPFTCNMCGEVCSDKFAFFVHIARTPHSEKTV